jgi:oligoribonuclease
MPELVQHLHYRIVDVSSIKELAKRWYGQDALYKHPQQPNAQPHRALFDINASIDELKWYRQTLFKPTTKPN